MRNESNSNFQTLENTRCFSCFSSFAIQDEVTVLLHQNQIELVIDGQKRVGTQRTRTLSGPLAELKKKATEISCVGFRATAYPWFSKGRNRIKVEAKSGRIRGKHAWKRAGIFDSEEDAVMYLIETKNRMLNAL